MLLTGTTLLVLATWGAAMVHGFVDTRRGSYAGLASGFLVLSSALVVPLWIPVVVGIVASVTAISVMTAVRWRSTAGPLGDRLLAMLGLGRG